MLVTQILKYTSQKLFLKCRFQKGQCLHARSTVLSALWQRTPLCQAPRGSRAHSYIQNSKMIEGVYTVILHGQDVVAVLVVCAVRCGIIHYLHCVDVGH